VLLLLLFLLAKTLSQSTKASLCFSLTTKFASIFLVAFVWLARKETPKKIGNFSSPSSSCCLGKFFCVTFGLRVVEWKLIFSASYGSLVPFRLYTKIMLFAFFRRFNSTHSHTNSNTQHCDFHSQKTCDCYTTTLRVARVNTRLQVSLIVLTRIFELLPLLSPLRQ